MTGTDTGIFLALVGKQEWIGADGRHYRREDWTIRGGCDDLDPSWRRWIGDDQEPSSRFTLYVINGEVDARLASYGGAVWPTAWPKLFVSAGRLGGRSGIETTDQLLEYREAALHGASDTYADARIL